MWRLSLVLFGPLLVASPAVAQLEMTCSVPGTYADISSTGTALGLGDEGVAEVPAGFDLTTTLFGGDGSGRVWVSNNGAVGFLADGGNAGAAFLNAPLPSFALFGGAHGTPQALAAYWDDLDSDTGDVYYETVGTTGSRVLIIQWQDRPHFDGDPVLDGNEATFQIQIFEDATAGTGYAQFLYADVDFQDPALDEGASATIGYQAGGHENDFQWSFDTPGVVQAGYVLTLREIGSGGANGDVNGDGVVDVTDFLLMLGTWGPCVDCCVCAADFDEDCEVSVTDFLLLLAWWS
ncbi:MAG: hypothetical protein ACYS15_01445 [Planctomycetota bacterium]|jgi:hypothetical protein